MSSASLTVAVVLALGAGLSRDSAQLGGTWEYVKVESLESDVPATGWLPVEVPGTLQGHNYERAWFRRPFKVPESWQGKRVLLRFGGVKFNSRVFVNGALAGGCLNGYDAFELDVTNLVRYGGDNELRVGVHDWTSLFTGERVSLPVKGEWSALRRMPRDRVVAPIGGRFDLYGIWDAVELVAAPALRVSDCFIRPLVRDGRLRIEVDVFNGTESAFSGALDAAVYDAGKDGTAIASGTVSVEAKSGNTATVSLDLPGGELKQWWPMDPNLCVLELKVGEDVFRERFGYREFWCEGGDFYLNGVKVHLLGRSWWPYEVPPTDEAIGAKIRMLKENNVNFFRTHTQPWPRRWYEMADEMGLMMMPEAAVFTDDETYRIEDAQFWENYARHLSNMVGNLKNHPSVVMWSLENEFCGVRAKRSAKAESNLARMGQLVKQLDATRPIVFESDGDPGGVADVIGLHYPNEFPERRVWPNDAYWMEAPNATRKDKMYWGAPEFLWDRSKPLYIGEFLWAPDESAATSTLFYGDVAYTDSRTYHFKAKADAWRMQILAYRHYGVSGFAPWGYDYIKPDGERRPVLEAQRDLFRPLAAFVREQDKRFFAGETVPRTLEIFNDTFRPVTGRLAWSVGDGSTRLQAGELAIALVAGEHREDVIELKMPEVAERTGLVFHVSLFNGDEVQFTEDWTFTVFPRHVLTPPQTPLFVCDPEGAVVSALQAANVPFTPLQSIDAWQGSGILVAGNLAEREVEESVAVIAPVSKQYSALARKVREGGRVLLLAQSGVSAACLPVRLTSLDSSMAFAAAPGHAIFKGMEPGDFFWWRGDCLVSQNEPGRPAFGGGRALVVTGSEQGLSHAPLIEMPDGEGLWLMCQLLVAEKFDSEPVAPLLLDRMLEYLDKWQPRRAGVAFAGSPDLGDELKTLGLVFDVPPDGLGLNAADYGLLVLQPDAPQVSELVKQLPAFVETGGNILVQRPSAAEFEEVRRVLNLPLERHPFSGPVSRAESDHPLVEAVLREDLHWIEERPGFSIAAPPRAKDMADATYRVVGGNAPVVALTSPAAIVAVPMGKGWVVVNSVKWDDAPGNELRARRFASSLLAALGGRFKAPEPVTVLEAEDMTPNAGIGAFTRAQDHVVMGANGHVSQEVSVAEAGVYRLRLYAKGSAVDGTYAIATVRLGEKELGRIECRSGSWSEFDVVAELPAGSHELRVEFVNDARRANEDRNLWLDRLEVSPAQ